MSLLARLNLLVLALLAAHTVDHALNQPERALPASGTVVGALGFVIISASAVLAVRRSSWAPEAAVFAGVATAAGIAAVHLTPSWWGFVSDPYWDFNANPLSWALALAPAVAGLALAIAGARALRSSPVTA